MVTCEYLFINYLRIGKYRVTGHVCNFFYTILTLKNRCTFLSSNQLFCLDNTHNNISTLLNILYNIKKL